MSEQVLSEAKVFAGLINAGIGPRTPAERFAREVVRLEDLRATMRTVLEQYAREIAALTSERDSLKARLGEAEQETRKLRGEMATIANLSKRWGLSAEDCANEAARIARLCLGEAYVPPDPRPEREMKAERADHPFKDSGLSDLCRIEGCMFDEIDHPLVHPTASERE